MKEWVGAVLSLLLAGAAWGWVIVRVLLCIVLLAGCGTSGATVLLSTICGTAAGAASGAVVARSVASGYKPMPGDESWRRAEAEAPKPIPPEWPALDAADDAAEGLVRP